MKEQAVHHKTFNYNPVIGTVMLIVALYFVWRSFYAMRIPLKEGVPVPAAHA
jgi:hypothetical protein